MPNQVKLARVENDLTQAELAEQVGVTRQTIGLMNPDATTRPLTCAWQSPTPWAKLWMIYSGTRRNTMVKDDERIKSVRNKIAARASASGISYCSPFCSTAS